jgi:hypothetical protein
MPPVKRIARWNRRGAEKAKKFFCEAFAASRAASEEDNFEST